MLCVFFYPTYCTGRLCARVAPAPNIALAAPARATARAARARTTTRTHTAARAAPARTIARAPEDIRIQTPFPKQRKLSSTAASMGSNGTSTTATSMVSRLTRHFSCLGCKRRNKRLYFMNGMICIERQDLFDENNSTTL